MELTKSVEVGNGAHIELYMPELSPGQQVEVRVVTSAPSTSSKRCGFGSLKGKIFIGADFDDPLPEFEEYR